MAGELISRETAIQTVHETMYQFIDDSEIMTDRDNLLLEANKAICNGLKEIPPVENKGEWIESKERSKHWYCSVCGGIHTDPETGKWRETFDYRYPFCPNCGARMKGGE